MGNLLSRRKLLSRSAVGATALALTKKLLSTTKWASVPATAQAAEVLGTTPGKGQLPSFKFALGAQKPRIYKGGTAKQSTATDFPIAKSIAGVYMTLNPGGLRELHWHANAAEWAFVFEGRGRISVLDPQGRREVNDFGPGDVWYFPRGHAHVHGEELEWDKHCRGDVWYFPRGHAHSIQGLGPGKTKFLLVFDNGYFSEFATFSVTDWIARTPKQIIAQNLGIPLSEAASFPKGEVYIADGPPPPALAQVQALGGAQPEAPLRHLFHLGAQRPHVEEPNGSLNLVSEKEFPISKTITGAFMRVEPGGLRELHWHPSADEWQFVSKGTMRLTVFASSGLASVTDLGLEDVGFVPMGYGHALANVGSEPLEAILVFNNGIYEEISLSNVIASSPPYLLETNFGFAREAVDKLPHVNRFFAGPRT
jgi:oxalate decarboxylase